MHAPTRGGGGVGGGRGGGGEGGGGGGGGGGAGWPKNCTHTCNNFQGVIVTPYSVVFSPPPNPPGNITFLALRFLCNNRFSVGMLELIYRVALEYW